MHRNRIEKNQGWLVITSMSLIFQFLSLAYIYINWRVIGIPQYIPKPVCNCLWCDLSSVLIAGVLSIYFQLKMMVGGRYLCFFIVYVFQKVSLSICVLISVLRPDLTLSKTHPLIYSIFRIYPGTPSVIKWCYFEIIHVWTYIVEMI